MNISISRSMFNRGFNDTVTLRHLRNLALGLTAPAEDKMASSKKDTKASAAGDGGSRHNRSLKISRDSKDGSLHVRKAS